MKTKKAEQKKEKHFLKRVGQAAAGAALAASLFIGGLFSSPKQIIDPNAGTAERPAVVQTAQLPPEPEFYAKAEAEPEKKRSFKERVAERLQRLPAAVRILFILPMWAIGFGILWAVSAIGALMQVPILGAVIKWMIGALVALALLLLAEKLIFPDVPVKKLLSKKNIAAMSVTAAVISAAGALGGYLWKDKQWITAAVDVGAAAVYAVFLLIFTRSDRRTAGR